MRGWAGGRNRTQAERWRVERQVKRAYIRRQAVEAVQVWVAGKSRKRAVEESSKRKKNCSRTYAGVCILISTQAGRWYRTVVPGETVMARPNRCRKVCGAGEEKRAGIRHAPVAQQA